MECPHCATALEEVVERGTTVSRCPECRGFWIATVDLRAYVDPLVDDSIIPPEEVLLVQPVVSGAKETSHPCPGCGEMLWLRDFSYNTGTVVERCLDCGGIWMEEAQVAEFVRLFKHMRATPAFAEEYRTQLDAEQAEEPPVSKKAQVYRIAGFFLPMVYDDTERSIFPWFTVGLIAANTLMLLYLILAGYTVPSFLLLVPGHVFDRGWGIALVTHMFLHAGFFHFAGNMVYLWVFGDNVEEEFGHRVFALFYALSGLGAAAFHILRDLDSEIPMVGASGAVAGVMGAYLVFHPKGNIVWTNGFLKFAMPAWVFLALWIAYQGFLALAESSGANSGIAWDAHIAGFVVGVVTALLFRLATIPAGEAFE